MHYELGRWLRVRYNTLVGPDWVPEELVVRSSDTDRTLMSAACNLAAFYFPKHDDERFDKHLPWMPTPIHTVPVPQDKVRGKHIPKHTGLNLGQCPKGEWASTLGNDFQMGGLPDRRSPLGGLL